jgi:hypothetical protein
MSGLVQTCIACAFILAFFYFPRISISGVAIWNCVSRQSLLDCLILWTLRHASCEASSIPWSVILGGIHLVAFYVSTINPKYHTVALTFSLVSSAVPIGCTLFWRAVVFLAAYVIFQDENELQTLLKTHQILFSSWPIAIAILAGNAIFSFEKLKIRKEEKKDIEKGEVKT